MIPFVILFVVSIIAIVLLSYTYRKNHALEEGFQTHPSNPNLTQEMPFIPQPPPPPLLPTLPGVAGMKCTSTDESNKSVAASSTGATYASSESDNKEANNTPYKPILEQIVKQFNEPETTAQNSSKDSLQIANILFNMHFSNVEIQEIVNNNTPVINIEQLNGLKNEINAELILLKSDSYRATTLKNVLYTIEKLEGAINSSPGSELDKMYRGVGYGVEDLERCAHITDTIHHDLKKNTYTKDEVDTIREQLKHEILDEIHSSGAGNKAHMGAVSTKMHENQVIQQKINEKGDSCVVQPLLSKGSAINVLDYTQVGSILPKFVYYEK